MRGGYSPTPLQSALATRASEEALPSVASGIASRLVSSKYGSVCIAHDLRAQTSRMAFAVTPNSAASFSAALKPCLGLSLTKKMATAWWLVSLPRMCVCTGAPRARGASAAPLLSSSSSASDASDASESEGGSWHEHSFVAVLANAPMCASPIDATAGTATQAAGPSQTIDLATIGSSRSISSSAQSRSPLCALVRSHCMAVGSSRGAPSRRFTFNDVIASVQLYTGRRLGPRLFVVQRCVSFLLIRGAKQFAAVKNNQNGSESHTSLLRNSQILWYKRRP